MVLVNHFEDHTVQPTSMLHEIISAQAYPEAGRDDVKGDRLSLLSIMLRNLLLNPKSKYSSAQQVSILLFRTVVGEDITGTQMRTPLELAKFLGLCETAQLFAVVQKMLCFWLFHEPNPDRINFSLEFLLSEVFPPSSHPLDALLLGEEAKAMVLP